MDCTVRKVISASSRARAFEALKFPIHIEAVEADRQNAIAVAELSEMTASPFGGRVSSFSWGPPT